MRNPRILVAFCSRTAVTERLATTIAEEAREAGAAARTRRAREVVGPEVMALVPGWSEGAAAMNARHEAPTVADAEWADAIVFGTPSRFGTFASELKAYIDSLGGLWFQGKLNGKVGAVFGSSSGRHGGNEATLLSLYTPLAHLGLVIVPLGYADPAMFRAGTPYGATAVSADGSRPPTEDDLAVARFQARRVVAITRNLTAGLITATKNDPSEHIGA